MRKPSPFKPRKWVIFVEFEQFSQYDLNKGSQEVGSVGFIGYRSLSSFLDGKHFCQNQRTFFLSSAYLTGSLIDPLGSFGPCLNLPVRAKTRFSVVAHWNRGNLARGNLTKGQVPCCQVSCRNVGSTAAIYIG
jgi:hypothetical protein